MTHPLDLVLFENDATQARIQMEHGLSSFMCDWEVLGKALRQDGFDTEIRPGTLADLQAIAGIPNARPWCRLNRHGPHTAVEIDNALAAGARVILLPMVTSLAEIEHFIEHASGRCQTGILIETQEAARLAPRMQGYPLDYVYFGLNDFAISRGGGNIFKALVDGSVDKVRQALPDHRFGVGGLTDLAKGYPIPASFLLEEMHRLGCAFTFLRRSYRRDALLAPPDKIIQGIHARWRQCALRTEAERQRDHSRLARLIDER